MAGTTCTLVLANETRGEVTCCSVGDSFAILVYPPTDGEGGASQPTIAMLSANDRLGDCETAGGRPV